MENILFFIGGGEFILLFVLFGLFGLLPLILIIVALIDIFKRDFENKSTDRLLIIILIVLVPIFGSIIYLLALRNSYPLLRSS